jgi:hypothetical protein
MPNDAKLGLVLGVGLVIAVAVVFFRRDLAAARCETEPAAGIAVQPAPASTPSVRGSDAVPVEPAAPARARPAGRAVPPDDAELTSHRRLQVPQLLDATVLLTVPDLPHEQATPQ